VLVLVLEIVEVELVPLVVAVVVEGTLYLRIELWVLVVVEEVVVHLARAGVIAI